MPKSKINIVSVFTWLCNVIDTQQLSSSEQLVLFHLVKFLNRNFWQAVRISDYKLAQIMGKKDCRTVTQALEKLKKKKLVIEKDGELHVGIVGADEYFSSNGTNEPSREPEKPPKAFEGNGKVKTLADYL